MEIKRTISLDGSSSGEAPDLVDDRFGENMKLVTVEEMKAIEKEADGAGLTYAANLIRL